MSRFVDEARKILSQPTAAVDEFARYRDDVAGFARDVLGEKLTAEQIAIAESVAVNERTAVRAGRKVGKSHVCAVILFWWVLTRPDGRGIITMPTYRQLRDIPFREIRAMWNRKLRNRIKGELFDVPERGLQLADGRSITGFSTDEPEKAAGMSGDEQLVVIDEASLIAASTMEVIDGNLAGGGRLLMLSNPTRTSGPYFDAFHSRAKYWHLIHIPSTSSPNVIAGRVVVKGLATLKWIDQKREEWGEGGQLFQVHIDGDFPTRAGNVVIQMQDAEAARARWDSSLFASSKSPLVLGVDVARYGDDETVIVARRGKVIDPPYAYKGYDVVQVAGKVLELARNLRRKDERVLIQVDVIGIGAGVVDHLKQHTDVDVVEVNAGAGAANPVYVRRRDELWFQMRDWIRDGGALPNDEKLIGELIAPVYSYEPSQRVKVEPKDETKKRLRRSPDRADAACLAVFSSYVPVCEARYDSPMTMDRVDTVDFGELANQRRVEMREWESIEPYREEEQAA